MGYKPDCFRMAIRFEPACWRRGEGTPGSSSWGIEVESSFWKMEEEERSPRFSFVAWEVDEGKAGCFSRSSATETGTPLESSRFLRRKRPNNVRVCRWAGGRKGFRSGWLLEREDSRMGTFMTFGGAWVLVFWRRRDIVKFGLRMWVLVDFWWESCRGMRSRDHYIRRGGFRGTYTTNFRLFEKLLCNVIVSSSHGTKKAPKLSGKI